MLDFLQRHSAELGRKDLLVTEPCRHPTTSARWQCIDFKDLEEPSETCEMCESQTIRYAHVVRHPDHPSPLRCGFDRAGAMSSDCEGAERRERLAKNAARRRDQWLHRNWKTSAKGNTYLKTDGFIITVFHDGPAWKARVVDSVSDGKRFLFR